MSHLVKYVRICTNEPPRKICTNYREIALRRCVSYVLEKHVSYARQQISYHMYAKTAYYFQAKHARAIRQISHFFAYQYHEFSFLFRRAIYTHFHLRCFDTLNICFNEMGYSFVLLRETFIKLTFYECL